MKVQGHWGLGTIFLGRQSLRCSVGTKSPLADRSVGEKAHGRRKLKCLAWDTHKGGKDPAGSVGERDI